MIGQQLREPLRGATAELALYLVYASEIILAFYLLWYEELQVFLVEYHDI